MINNIHLIPMYSPTYLRSNRMLYLNLSWKLYWLLSQSVRLLYTRGLFLYKFVNLTKVKFTRWILYVHVCVEAINRIQFISYSFSIQVSKQVKIFRTNNWNSSMFHAIPFYSIPVPSNCLVLMNFTWHIVELSFLNSR